ncbi:MAG: hypothetical protein AB7F86_08040 [Bdellovibrionales bacterium]
MLQKLFAFVGFSFLVACGSSHQVIPGSEGNLETSGALDFESVKAAVLQPAGCIDCHSQYAQYSGVKREIDRMVASVKAGRMPKSGPLAPALQKILADWAAAGAPEKADPSSPSEPVDIPLMPTFQSVNANILLPKCVVCHNPNGKAKFLDLSSRQVIFDQRDREFLGEKLLSFEKPETSYLMTVIQDQAEPMPPVWSNIPLLTPNEISTMIQWIRLGLP